MSLKLDNARSFWYGMTIGQMVGLDCPQLAKVMDRRSDNTLDLIEFRHADPCELRCLGMDLPICRNCKIIGHKWVKVV